MSLGHIAAVNGFDKDSLCMYMLRTTHNSENTDDAIRQWAFIQKDASVQLDISTRTYINEVFSLHFDRFSQQATPDLTHRIWFSPDELDVGRMITSIFGHKDIMHLAMNLFFFFAFAATVELVIGGLSMLASVVLLAILSNLFYAFISHMHGVFMPTVGLSGIVFGMMGMFICFMPQANVKCFFWFVVIFKRFAIPAWLITLAYVSWNIYDWVVYGNNSETNFIIHIAGAAFGYLVGVFIFRASKERYLATSTARNVNRRYSPGQLMR